jgi:hypothetical protein
LDIAVGVLAFGSGELDDERLAGARASIRRRGGLRGPSTTAIAHRVAAVVPPTSFGIRRRRLMTPLQQAFLARPPRAAALVHKDSLPRNACGRGLYRDRPQPLPHDASRPALNRRMPIDELESGFDWPRRRRPAAC